jgi:hypothetical protein
MSRAGGDVAANVGHEIEGLAGFQAPRHIDFFHEHFRRGCIVQRHGEQLDILRREPRGGGFGLAGGVVAVGEQHDAPGRPGREDGTGEIERAADVRGLSPVRFPGPDSRVGVVRGWFFPEFRARVESDQAVHILCMFRRAAGLDEFGGFLPRGVRNAGRFVEDEEDGQILRGQQPAETGQGEHQQEHDEGAQDEADLALERSHVGQRAALGPHEEDDEEQKAQRPGMGEIDQAVHSVRLR